MEVTSGSFAGADGMNDASDTGLVEGPLEQKHVVRTVFDDKNDAWSAVGHTPVYRAIARVNENGE